MPSEFGILARSTVHTGRPFRALGTRLIPTRAARRRALPSFPTEVTRARQSRRGRLAAPPVRESRCRTRSSSTSPRGRPGSPSSRDTSSSSSTSSAPPRAASRGTSTRARWCACSRACRRRSSTSASRRRRSSTPPTLMAPTRRRGGARRARRRTSSRPRRPAPRRRAAPIEQRLQKGQEVLVQVSKEPIGTKGARVTAHISLPGRYLVLMPDAATSASPGASRTRRARPPARDRRGERPAEGGLIVRTAAEGATKRELHDDVRFLTRLWGAHPEAGRGAPRPGAGARGPRRSCCARCATSSRRDVDRLVDRRRHEDYAARASTSS